MAPVAARGSEPLVGARSVAGTGPAAKGKVVGRYPCFDGLRAIAALMVIGVHTTFASGFTGRHIHLGLYAARLEIGVEVFFVISGFLLYRPFALAHFGLRSAPGLKSFWMRRLRRIIPAYWLAFIVVTYVMRADIVRHAWYSPFIYLGFLQIYFPHYVLSGLTQAWSLCTEMTFYLAVPLYAAAVARKARDHDAQLKVELLGLAALVVVSYAFRSVMLVQHTELGYTMTNSLPAYADLFALGILLAVTSTYFIAADRRPAFLWSRYTPWLSWGLAAGAFVAVSLVGLPKTPVTQSGLGLSLARQALYGLFGFFTVLPAVFGPQDRGLIRGFLRFKPLAAVGVVSYGVYLWHESWMHMFFVWSGDQIFRIWWPLMYTSVAALAIVSASLSYFLVERPILRYRTGSASPGLVLGRWRRPGPAPRVEVGA